MKIKKSDLTHLIESYIKEQMSVPVSAGGNSSDLKYPETVTTDSQKEMYRLSGVADKRRMSHPDSEAVLKWPQDFVIFEDVFEHHVKSWQSFSRLHPKSAAFIQFIDLSGVSGWGDMAKSIEDVHKPNASHLDNVMFFLNMLSSSPIALVLSLSGGRLFTWVANKILPLAQGGNMSAKLSKIANSTDEFAKLFDNVAETKLFKGAIGNLANKLVESGKITAPTASKIMNKADDIFESCRIVLAGLDSFAFRAFAKFVVVVADKISEDLSKLIVEFYMKNPNTLADHSQEAIALGKHIFKSSPAALQDVIDAGINNSNSLYDMLANTLGLD